MTAPPADFTEQRVADLQPGGLFWFDFGRTPMGSRIESVERLESGNILVVHTKGRAEFNPECVVWAKSPAHLG